MELENDSSEEEAWKAIKDLGKEKALGLILLFSSIVGVL